MCFIEKLSILQQSSLENLNNFIGRKRHPFLVTFTIEKRLHYEERLLNYWFQIFLDLLKRTVIGYWNTKRGWNYIKQVNLTHLIAKLCEVRNPAKIEKVQYKGVR